MNNHSKRYTLMAVLLSVLTSLLTGCGTAPVNVRPVQAGYVESDLEREKAVDVPSGSVSAQVQGNTDFAFDLYQQLIHSSDGNLFYSPYSISLALAMAYAGAKANTEKQMAEVMHYNLPEAALHATLNHLDQVLASRGEGAQGADGEGFRLNVVNAMWGQQDYEFEQAYLDTLAQHYGAGLHLLNFTNAPEASRKTINYWVSEQTEDRIKDLIPEGVLDAMTRLVLTNAIYFNAAWAETFVASATAEADFTLLDGATVRVPMMSLMTTYGYAEGAGFQIVELPYDNHELAMDILLPQQGAFEDFEAGLTGEKLSAMLSWISYQNVRLTMPKFEVESEFSLSDALKALGMTAAFDVRKANFTGIHAAPELYISDVLHKSFIKVDEDGTEAAAATGVVVKSFSTSEQEPIVVTVDRPFIFVIRDLETGAILFVGRVVDPSK